MFNLMGHPKSPQTSRAVSVDALDSGRDLGDRSEETCCHPLCPRRCNQKESGDSLVQVVMTTWPCWDEMQVYSRDSFCLFLNVHLANHLCQARFDLAKLTGLVHSNTGFPQKHFEGSSYSGEDTAGGN